MTSYGQTPAVEPGTEAGVSPEWATPRIAARYTQEWFMRAPRFHLVEVEYVRGDVVEAMLAALKDAVERLDRISGMANGTDMQEVYYAAYAGNQRRAIERYTNG